MHQTFTVASTVNNQNRRTRILILGNGFDLDFGFQTTYHRFCDSFFKSKELEVCTNSPLYNFLKKNTKRIQIKSGTTLKKKFENM